MSDILLTNINSVEPMFDEPTTVSKPSKRWRLASATTPSFVVLNVQPDAFSGIDQTSLNAMVRKKKVDQLLEAHEVLFDVLSLLWLTLILDTLCAIALATQQPTKDLKEGPPVSQTQPLITNIMWRNILSQAVYQIAVGLTLNFKGESIFHVNEKVKNTLILNISALCQVFNLVNAKKLEKKNKLFWGTTGIAIVLEVVAVEFFKKFGDTERLSWGQWAACIGVAAVSWPIGFLVKYIPV